MKEWINIGNIVWIQQTKYVDLGQEDKKSLKIPEVIIICESKKNKQHNGQKKTDKRTNNDLQKYT